MLRVINNMLAALRGRLWRRRKAMKYKLEGKEAHEIIYAGIKSIYGDIVNASKVTGTEPISCTLSLEDGSLSITWWVGPNDKAK